jgi:predicted nucleic acid-binding protein
MAPEWNTALRVLEWTERLGQPVAYDAVYVELADRMQAELWTADRRLAVAARSVGLEWVHHVDDRLPNA